MVGPKNKVGWERFQITGVLKRGYPLIIAFRIFPSLEPLIAPREGKTTP